ncbi:MAG: chromosome segregation protein SMC, partial [Azospira oryzae]
MSATPIEEPKKKTSSRNTIIISVLAVIVVVQSIKIYLDYKDKVEITEQKVSVEQE